MAVPRLAPFLIALAGSLACTMAFAQHVPSCSNGKTLYTKTVPSTDPFSCSNSLCHGANVDKKSIQAAAGNPSLIDQALDGVEGNAEMVALDLRNQLGLTYEDLQDIAEYIFQYGANKKCPTVTPANVTAAPTSLAFGSVEVGSTSTSQTVTLSNSGGTASGNISYPAAPAGYTKSGTCANGPLGASGTPTSSCTLTFAFSPTVPGTANATYTLGGPVAISISLSGAGTAVTTSPNVGASPANLAFGGVTVGTTSAAKTVTVTNTGTAAATDMSYPAAPASYAKGGTCGGANLAAGASCTLTFAYSPTSTGSDSTTYTFSGGGKAVSITITGSGIAPAAATLDATPSMLSFGSITVGSTSAAQAVTLRNTGGAAASAISLANSNAVEFVVSGNTCGSTLNPGATCTLSVAYRPGGAGQGSGALTFSHAGGSAATVSMTGTGTQATSPSLAASPPLAAFGNVTVGQTSAATAFTITNTGGAAATSVALANSNGGEFVVSGNTCGATLAAGASCSLSVAYAPGAAGSDSTTLTFTYAGGGALAISLTGTGVASTPPPGTGQLSLPAVISMPDTTVGTASASQVVTLGNVGTVAVSVSSITSANAAEFVVSGSTCSTVSAGSSCTFGVTFAPAAAGARSGTITVTSTGAGSPQAIMVSGNGLPGPGGPLPPADPNVVTAVEYYHAAFDHYFITSIADEIGKLDSGVFVGWQRTGKQFNVYRAATGNLNAVCRFFSTAFDPKSSHFYTPDAGECTTVKANKDWQFEAEVFYTRSPAPDGTCPAGTNPVYRLYNDGQGAAPNHRYTTDFGTRAQMLLKGWMAEGYGVGVIMCAPQ